MGFGPVDLISVFLGPAWLAKEAIVGHVRSEAWNTRGEKIRNYIAENTDPELQIKVEEFVKNPDNYDAIYDYLEQFKRDNPEWCKEHEERVRRCRGLDYGEENAWYEEPVRFLDWYNVGKTRFPYWSSEFDRGIAVLMIMNSLGVKTVQQARTDGENIYPKPKPCNMY